MARFAVIGQPVAHSRSPEIHEAFARQFGITLRYERLAAPVDGFEAAAEAFFRAGGAGLNVTLPFKAEACAWVTAADAAAQAAGAVNTIVPLDGGYTGYNTDGLGLVRDLQENRGLKLRGLRVLMLGAGGAAAGALGPLLGEGPATLALANRTEARAHALAERFPGVTPVSLTALDGPWDLIINATALGTRADEEMTFERLLPPALLGGAFAYDMFYGAAARFAPYAAAQGAAGVADGLGMLVEQAAAAFTLWHGRTPDTAQVIAALRGNQEPPRAQH
ncbi:MAG: shikimate dehydrogenase [Pseudomonadota bacterium]